MTTEYPTVDALLADEHSWSGRPVVRTVRLDDETVLTVRGRGRWGYAATAERFTPHEVVSAGCGYEGSWPATVALAIRRLEQSIARTRLAAVSRAEMHGTNTPYLDYLAGLVLDSEEWTRAELRDELIARAADAGVSPATIARLIGTARGAVYRAIERRRPR